MNLHGAPGSVVVQPEPHIPVSGAPGPPGVPHLALVHYWHWRCSFLARYGTPTVLSLVPLCTPRPPYLAVLRLTTDVTGAFRLDDLVFTQPSKIFQAKVFQE